MFVVVVGAAAVQLAYPSFQHNIVLKEIVGQGSGGAIHKAE